MIVSRSIEIDAAHYLPGYKGKCANLHGHRWKIELAVSGKIQNNGMVVDFSVLNRPLEIVEEQLDHKCVNDIISNPTAENIVAYVRSVFTDWWLEHGREDPPARFSLAWIRVWETEDSYAMLKEIGY